MTEPKKRPLICIVLTAVLMLVFGCTAFASDETEQETILKAEDIDPDRDLSLTVSFTVSGEAVSGAEIAIYKVADVYTENYGVFYTAVLGDYSYEGMTADESIKAAQELSEIVAGTDCERYAGTTDSFGNVIFSSLSQGIYLVVLESEVFGDDGTQYVFDPYLACVPLAMEEDGIYVWTYDVVSTPKTAGYIEPEEETTVPEEETQEETTPSEEETQNPDEPSVGDGTELILWLLAAASASVCMAAAVLSARRGRKKNN